MPGRVLTQVRAQLVYHALSVMRSRHASRAAGRARRVSAMSESIRPFIRGLHAYSARCAGGARVSCAGGAGHERRTAEPNFKGCDALSQAEEFCRARFRRLAGDKVSGRCACIARRKAVTVGSPGNGNS
jgi:hypothetical protein